MIEKKIGHYSLEHAATIYDEEAMTALELAARTAALVNGLVDYTNETNRRVDLLYKTELQKHVNKWLDEHPEATTTVQDGSLTMEKLTAELRKQLENAYVTPDMFGAVGDGIADDTEAFRTMFETRERAFIKSGTYKITQPLTAYNSISAETGATILYYPGSEHTNIGCINIKGQCEDIYVNIEGEWSSGYKYVLLPVAEISESINVGDFIRCVSNDKVSVYARDYDVKEDILQVSVKTGNMLEFTTTPEWTSLGSFTLSVLRPVNDIEITGLKIVCMNFASYSSGIRVEYAHNVSVSGCSLSNFDYAGIDIRYSINAHASNNYCAVNYRDALQYGIMYYGVYHGTINGNTVNSARTAIDLSGGSQYVSVTGNSTNGSINTHWAINCAINGNTINEGFILLRGKKLTVSNNVVTNKDRTEASCITIFEAGVEGGHVISGNKCYGIIDIAVYASGVRLINNTLIAIKPGERYDNDNRTALIRISSAPNTEAFDVGFEISGNHIEYVGSELVDFGVDMQWNTDVVYNARISNNVIRNVKTAINAVVRTSTVGDNCTITGNDIHNVQNGIIFRGMNNTIITNNNIRGSRNENRIYVGVEGIKRYFYSHNTSGLTIAGNMICGFNIALRINEGNGIIHSFDSGNNNMPECDQFVVINTDITM